MNRNISHVLHFHPQRPTSGMLRQRLLHPTFRLEAHLTIPDPLHKTDLVQTSPGVHYATVSEQLESV